MLHLQPTNQISRQDLQFQLVLSYIRHTSQKLAFKESQLMLQSVDFINLITSFQQKSSEEPSTKQVSFQNNSYIIQHPSSPRNRQRQPFKRRTKRVVDRHTFKGLEQALEQVKQLCSESAIVVIEKVFVEYKKMLDQISQIDYNKDNFGRKRCHSCQYNEVTALQLQQRIKKIGGQLQEANIKNQELNTLLQKKLSQIQTTKAAQNTQIRYAGCKGISKFKQSHQIKLAERQIILSLNSLSQLNGCQRCASIRKIKSQIVSFRTYLQRQCQSIDQLYMGFKKRFDLIF